MKADMCHLESRAKMPRRATSVMLLVTAMCAAPRAGPRCRVEHHHGASIAGRGAAAASIPIARDGWTAPSMTRRSIHLYTASV